MRIIGGQARGRTLHFLPGSKERPTSDFLREALFNLLGPLPEKTFLDLFAGSGSVGIEAGSRGAKEITFIEKDRKIAAVAQKNIDLCGFDKKCRVLVQDIRTGLNGLHKKKYVFDIIFADPPYSQRLVGETIKLLNENPVITEETVIVIQHSIREDFESLLDKKTILTDQRKYGDNALTFLKMERS